MSRKSWQATERFERWLRRKHPCERLNYNCPIEAFLNRRSAVKKYRKTYRVHTPPFGITIGNDRLCPIIVAKLPVWTEDFLNKVEEESAKTVGNYLKILNVIKEKHNEH